MKWAMSKGGVYKLQILGREKIIDFSKHRRPKRSLNARLGHSKVLGPDRPRVRGFLES